MRYSKSEFRYGVIQPTMPVLTYIEGRLLPQLFKGAQFTSQEIDNLKLTLGRIEQVKDRGSSSYDSMKLSGAREDSNKFNYAGADYQLNKNLLLQYYYGNLEDFYRQHFVGVVNFWELGGGKLKLDLRYFHSTSDGENKQRNSAYSSSGYFNNGLTPRGEVDNDLYSGMFTYTLGSQPEPRLSEK